MRFPRLAFALASLGLISACADLSYRRLQKSSVPWQFEWTSGACYGSCPVYRASLDQSGKLRFEGIAQTAHRGDTVLDLGQSFADSLLLQLKTMDYLAMDSLYGVDSTVFDVQQISFHLQSEGEGHKVRCQMERPESLGHLLRYLNHSLDQRELL